MKAVCIGALLGFYLVPLRGASGPVQRELIEDNQFRRGVVLWETEPGKHVRYGELKGLEAAVRPSWGLSQWSSKYPLDPGTAMRGKNFLVCSNAAKSILLGSDGHISMAVNTALEYGERARKTGEPWVHLLIEQEFASPARLVELSSAKLHLEARLIRSRNLHQGDYTSDTHAAQFQIFFTVQNRNRLSAGHGDMLWFGVPVYDNRERFPKAFKAQDFGGTAKYIFTMDGRTFSTRSAHEGGWVLVEKDLLPLMQEALQSAWDHGFLKGSKTLSDYYIGGMNMGWELPGTFDVELQVRGLSLKLSLAQNSSSTSR